MNYENEDISNMEYLETEARHKSGRVIQIIGLVLCIIAFILCSVFAAIFSSGNNYAWFSIRGNRVYGSIISGLLSQIQVIITILIVLNPIKNSRAVAIALNAATALVASRAFVFDSNFDAFLGIVVPANSIIISLIISNYSYSLNRQLKKLTRYNRIMKKNDEMLYQMAYYDPLTELPNRRMILEKIRILTNKRVINGKGFYFVLIDLDNFKKINDTLGHSVGDEILIHITHRWKELIKSEDILGRMGGDEFALIINRSMDRNDLSQYLDRLRKTLARVITIDHKEFFIRASFGITVFPDDGSDINELLKKADIALYKAKSSRKSGIMFFNSEIQDEIMKRIHIENGLMSSIENNELYTVFQPIFRCDTREVRGFEALARWHHPELGQVSPGQFIPVAEETGIIIEIGKWIIRSVVREFSELKNFYNITPVVSINISVVQMIDSSFVSMVREILNETGFDGRYLEFEITESVFISYPEQIIEVINELKKLGIRIALDDFGTGYASLSYLQLLPINTLKIDKSFIDKISENDDKQIVGSIISMAHMLGMEVIAEGVELNEQLNYLSEQECDYIQGFLLSKPVDKKDMVNHIMRPISNISD